MATSNTRDVKMTLSVETLGAEEIGKLQANVTNLAKAGGDAAPEFQHLADEIGRLGEQAAALQAFQRLADETAQLAERQGQAAAASTELRTKLDGLSAVSQEAANKQQLIATALLDAQNAARATRDELATLSATTDRAGKTEDAYAASVSKLKVAKIEQRAEIERLSAALTASNSEVRAAEAAESKLESAYQRASKAATAAGESLAANTASVNRAASAALDLGLSTENVASEQVQLVRALNQSATSATTLKEHVERLAESQRELDGIRAFEKQAEAARRLVVAGEYAGLFDEALRRLAATERELQTSDNAAKWQKESFAMVEAAHAAQKLAQETQLLSAVEQELAAQAAFQKQAEDSRNLIKSAEYVRFWREELDKAELQAKQTADAARLASQKISDAFRTLGVRSAQELQAEIGQVRSALDTVRATSAATGNALSGAFAAGEAKVAALQRELRAANGELTLGDKAAKLFSNSLGQIAAGNIVADGVGYLVNKVKELGRSFLEAVVQGDQMRRGLTAVYGSAEIAAKQIDFLRKSSSESGVAFGQLGGEFVKFSASMKSANIPLDQSNKLFQALTAASATLGLGTEATAGALNALGQIASKGVVSMEELRQQLGDRLPGAMGLTAKGLGITEAQLVKLVETGGLAARDFIEPFTAALGTMKGEVDGLVPAYDRFKGVLSETAQALGDAGGTLLLTAALKVLGGLVATITLGLSTFVEALFLAGSGVTALAARLTGDTKAWEFFGEQVEKSTARLTNQARAFNAFLDPAAAAANATTRVAVAMTANTEATVKLINANTSLNSSQKLTALSTALAADATLSAAAKMVQYNVAAGEFLKLQEVQTTAYEKLAKAAKHQGDTLVELAKLTSDTTTIQNASVVSAELLANATDKVAKSQAEETAILVGQRAELVANTRGRTVNADAIKAEIDAIDKLLLKSRADTEQKAQESIAARQALFERKLAVEALKDHSKEIGTFKKAVDDAAVTVKEYERLVVTGKKTEDDLTEARKNLAAATVRYKDSLADAIRNVEADSKAKEANLQLSIAQSNTAQKHSEIMATQARIQGDLTTATYYDIKAKEQQIATMKLEIQLRTLEAEAAKATIELKKQELIGDDDLTVSKRKILDIELQIIKVRLEGNNAAKETIRAIENEITALRTGVDARAASTTSINTETGARGSNTGAINAQTDALDRIAMKYKLVSQYTERQIELLERETAATQKAIDTENKRRGVDSQGFSADEKGNRINMGGDLTTRTGVFNFLKLAGVTDEKVAKDITNEFADNQGNIEYFGNKGQKKYGGEYGSISTALLKAAEGFTFSSADGGNQSQKTSDTQPGNTTTVNVNIGGKSTAIKVASQADANALTGMLRQLESASGVSA